MLGLVVCVAVDAYAASGWNCPAGADCEPVTWANWTWLGIGMGGLWLLAAAMGFAVADRLRRP